MSRAKSAMLKNPVNSLYAGLLRVRRSWLGIVQVSVAAGAAFWVAKNLFGHPLPFFAPMAAIIVLGLTGGDRIRRAIELVVGVSLGVGLGDFIISWVGSGTWQIMVAVTLSLVLATLVDKGPLVANQAAFGSILIATILPPGTSGGTDRMSDAFIGGMVGLIIMSLIPISPLSAGRKEIAIILEIISDVLTDVAHALRINNADVVRHALAAARGTQGNINNMIAAAKGGKESMRMSPLLWPERRRVKSLIRILNPVDNAIRNTRVLARRALVLLEDHDTVSEKQIQIIEELADVASQLSVLYMGKTKVSESAEIPMLVKRLRKLGSAAGLDVAEGRVLSAQVILAQTRSIIVDLLQVCGLSKKSAVAVLKPTSEHPAMPPELWD
ncbi:hypothetical protein CDUR_12145 [Corynebacterium durum]|nr:uncharacterized membrane protein YgaE (UPF0421/DUF939 family) [Corynebacterium durum]WJY86137.1 hypothetical protein CDUR_12145 [Corynebacterium durum]